MKIELDTNNPGDKKIIELVTSVIAAEMMPASCEDCACETSEQSPPDRDVPAGQQSLEQDIVDQVVENEEVDTDGEIWDPDLHASTKSKTKDGRWKKRRNVETKEEAKPLPVKTPNPKKAVSETDYIKALTDHRNKFGIDRTNAVVKETTGAEHVRDVAEGDRPALVRALEEDQGPQGGFDLGDF